MAEGEAAAAPPPPEDGLSISSSLDPPPLHQLTSDAVQENLSLSMVVDDLPYHPNPSPLATGVDPSNGIETQHSHHNHHHLGFNVGNSFNNSNSMDAHLLQEVIHEPNHSINSLDQSTWGPSVLEFHDQPFHPYHLQNINQSFNMNVNMNNASPLPDAPPYPTPDLLNLLHLPRSSASPSSSLLPSSSISFSNSSPKTPNYQNSTLGFLGDNHPAGVDHFTASSVLCDPLFHLNLPPQPPIFRDLFQSLPHGYSLPTSRNVSLFGGGDEIEGSGGGVYQDGDGNGVLEFTRDMAFVQNKKEGKHPTTEKQRRQNMTDKYQDLRSLVPNPSKGDRASIVMDAIYYIRELKGTLNELNLLVEKKRCEREQRKRRKIEDDAAAGEIEDCEMKPVGDPDQSFNGSLRSSWLQRKSKDTEVDVRIIDNEVTIKIVQRKKFDFLLLVSKVLLDELQLDLHYVGGGHVGDYCSFFFNTKISEGSSVYASAIANKLIEAMETQYSAIPPNSSFSRL